MTLVNYIPSALEVDNCIKTVAEGAHEAVLIAVHQPTPLSKKLVHGTEKEQASEEQLLSHILTNDVPTGALVVPITGASGAGKSHLIRIVEARLRSAPEAKRHLIIRIPKSASLRGVVELILAPLPDAQYASVKTAFVSALAEINVESAAIRFEAELQITLRQLASGLLEKVRQTSTQVLREQLDHANRLPLLFRDPVTSEHFRKGVFPRIVNRAVAGDNAGALDPTEGQFRSSDLDLPDEVDLGQAGRPVANYYRLALQSRNGEGKSVAVEVLNSVVDQATRQLFSLHEALGGMTLQDVILEIRRRLLAEGRDLVLLVEDFAALTGIQETLARVLIQEGVRDGRPEFATMRSVIAVTDGYLVSRDTLATRAMNEWIVESEIRSEEEIFERTRALIASYLNASRWGEAELIARFARRRKVSSTHSKDWLTVYRADDDETTSRLLGAFGFHQEIPFFPFSDLAIQHLAKRALRYGDTLVFNPRFIISEILRRVLPGAREAFVANAFPVPGIEAKRASAEVAAWSASLHEVEAVKRRYETVAVVWGDSPPTLAQVADIPNAVFEAFGLRAPSLEQVGPRPPRPERGGGPVPPPKPMRQEETEKYRVALEEWVQGNRMSFQMANVVRKHLATALNEQIDWNAERCLRALIQADAISIPNARGEDNLQADPIKIAEDNIDSDGRLRGELLSLLRLYEVHPDGQYQGDDDDLVRVASFVERLLPEARKRIRSRTIEQLRLALHVMSGNSRVLGMAEVGKTPKALSSFLFGNPEAQESLPAIVRPESIRPAVLEWRELQANASRIRASLKDLVLANSGCFQGTGETANGVDIVRIAENYPAHDMRVELARLERLSAEDKSALAGMSEARVGVRYRAMRTEAMRLKEAVSKALGVTFDKETVSSRLKELANAMREMGAWDSDALGVSQPAFLSLCELFRVSALKESLEQLSQSDATDGATAKQSQVHFRMGPLLVASEFLQKADAVIRSAERRASTLEQQFGGITPEAQANAIQQSFANLQERLQSLK